METLNDNPVRIYEDDSSQAIEVRLDTFHETVWLSQKQMADVF